MSETRLSDYLSRLCLTVALVLVFLAWGAASANAPALDHQLDGLDSYQAVLLGSSGDSPSTELGPPHTVLPIVFRISGDLVFSPNLLFVQPPARFLSYPALPQGPPFLV